MDRVTAAFTVGETPLELELRLVPLQERLFQQLLLPLVLCFVFRPSYLFNLKNNY